MAKLNPKPSRSKTGLVKTKYDVIKNASILTGASQYDVQRIFEACLVSIISLAAKSRSGTRIVIRGFGTFLVCEFAEQTRNMTEINGKIIRTPSRRRVVFRPHKQFKMPRLKNAEFFAKNETFTAGENSWLARRRHSYEAALDQLERLYRYSKRNKKYLRST